MSWSYGLIFALLFSHLGNSAIPFPFSTKLIMFSKESISTTDFKLANFIKLCFLKGQFLSLLTNMGIPSLAFMMLEQA